MEVSALLWSFAMVTMVGLVLAMGHEPKSKSCDHDWRDIFGDEINAAGCRSICRKCGKRSHKLMGPDYV